jgi:hypothetical protein
VQCVSADRALRGACCILKPNAPRGGLQIPAFKKSEHTMTIDLTAHNLIIRNNAFFEWFDYDRGKADQKARHRCRCPCLHQVEEV